MDFGKHIEGWQKKKQTALMSEKKPTLNRLQFSEDKFRLVFIGDEHIDNKTYDEKAHRQQVKWCLDNKVPVIHMGDALECATRDSVGAGVYEQQAIIDDQIEHFYNIYKPLARENLILGMHMGNHEQRVWKSSGVDITKMMAKELKVPYFGWGKLHYIVVNREGYSLYTTHGAMGARLPHTKMKACLDLAHMAQADIYAMGHTHQLAHHTRTFYQPDLRNKTVTTKEKHFILTGSYLNHWGSYGHEKNYEPMKVGSPMLTLGGKEHLIRVSL